MLKGKGERFYIHVELFLQNSIDFDLSPKKLIMPDCKEVVAIYRCEAKPEFKELKKREKGSVGGNLSG